MNRAVAVLMTALLVLAGCLGSEEAGQQEEAQTDGEAPNAASSQREAPTSSGQEGPSTTLSTAAPPAWQLGEWWTIEMTSQVVASEPVTWTRVVAGVEGQDYLLGQPRDAWNPHALLYHVPGLGEVAMDDLSYEVHDARFHPLQFPLQDGAEWETEFEGVPITAQATENDDGTVDIWYCCGANITATYDPSIGALSHFEVEGLITYEVLDHGYGHEGIVTVPHGHDLVFMHGRIGPALDTNLEPAPPTGTLELSDDYGRVTFAQIVGEIAGQDAPTGAAYLERATGPDGTVYETQKLPGEPAGLKLQLFETTELGGTWELEHVAAGPGLAFTEGIAYHVFDVQLPEGTLLGDHSQHITE